MKIHYHWHFHKKFFAEIHLGGGAVSLSVGHYCSLWLLFADCDVTYVCIKWK